MKRPLFFRIASILPCVAFFTVAHAQDSAQKPAAEGTDSAAPASKDIELKDPVATVNGEPISAARLQEAFDDAVRASGVDPSMLTPDQKLGGYNSILDSLIIEKLLQAEAKDIEVTDQEVEKEISDIKSQFPNEEAFQQQIAQAGKTVDELKGLIRNGLKERKWIESQIGDQAKIADEEVRKFYDENIEQFKQPETVRASHILFMVPEDASEEEAKKKEAEAKAAYEKAKAGEDFAKLADELSEDPGNKGPDGKGQGGDLSYFAEGQMVPEFSKAAFSAEKGEVVGPVKTQFGYHVIKVTDKKPAETASFEEIEPQLKGYLESQKEQVAVQELIAKLRNDAKIETSLPTPQPQSGAPAGGDEAETSN